MKSTAINTAIEIIENNNSGILAKMQEIAAQKGMTAEQFNEFKNFTAAAIAACAVENFNN